MASHIDKVNALVRSHIDGHEVTQEEYNAFLDVVKQGEEKLRQKWLLVWPQFRRQLSKWIGTVHQYCYRFDVLMAIATYKKLVSNPSDRDMRALYWGLWLLEVCNVCAFAIDDIVDNSADRFGSPAMHVVIGPKSTICIDTYIKAALGDIMEEVLAGKPYLDAFRRMHREFRLILMWATIIDVPAAKLEDWECRFTWSYFDDRVKYTAHLVLWYPLTYAYLLAGKPTNSQTCESIQKMLYVVSEAARVGDDVGDWEEDLQNRRVTWTTMKCFEKDENIVKAYFVEKAEGSLVRLEEFHRQMGLINLFKEYEAEQRAKFNLLLDQAPDDEIPKRTWRAMYEFGAIQWLKFWHPEGPSDQSKSTEQHLQEGHLYEVVQ